MVAIGTGPPPLGNTRKDILGSDHFSYMVQGLLYLVLLLMDWCYEESPKLGATVSRTGCGFSESSNSCEHGLTGD